MNALKVSSPPNCLFLYLTLRSRLGLRVCVSKRKEEEAAEEKKGERVSRARVGNSSKVTPTVHGLALGSAGGDG